MLLAAVVLTGCGGGGNGAPDIQRVRAAGYSFAAPADWKVSRTSHVVSATRPGSDADLVSVSTYSLPRVPTRAQIEAAAKSLAVALKGRVISAASIRIAGKSVPQFRLSYSRGGKERGLRLTFFIKRKTEFQLLCRWQAPPDDQIEAACDSLGSTFTPA